MMILSFLSLYLIFAILYLKIFKNDRLLKLVPLLYFGIFVITSLISYFFEEEVIPGKPDQIGYMQYGEDCSSQYYELEIFKVFLDEIKNRKGHHPFYWALSCFVYGTSVFPKETLRLINFIVLLALVIIFYKTQILITNDYSKSLLNTKIFVFMPSFLLFSIYIIRDLFIILFWSICFYLILKIYTSNKLSVKNVKNFIYLLIWIPLLYLAREHAAFSLVNIFLFSLIYKRLRNVILVLSVFLVFLGIIYTIQAELHGLNILKAIIGAILIERDFIMKILYKLPLYFLSLGFLDPTTDKTFSFSTLLISKFFYPDSVIIPLLFLLKFKKIINSQYRGIVFGTIFAFLLYFTIYMYAEDYFTGNYGFHFRAYLPFFYAYTVFTLPYLNLNITLNRSGLFHPLCKNKVRRC